MQVAMCGRIGIFVKFRKWHVVLQIRQSPGKRQRILDTYFEGVINASERDLSLAAVEREKQTLSNLSDNIREVDTLKPVTLAEMFLPFVEFDLLNRDQKRRLLNTITPQIVAADYTVSGIYFSGLLGSHKAAVYDKAERIYLPLRRAA
ncbi:hypothetical protein BH20ACI3_BH20ACI3_38980 [soil metagenome]